jgi:ribosomal protein L11 methyltransferase
VPWLALLLEAPAERLEALSEALLEAGAQSVWLEPDGRLQAMLGAQADAHSVLEGAARAAGVAAPPYETQVVGDRDWVRATQAQFTPQCFAGRLWVVPSWHEPPREGVVVRLDPGLAFGTGSHPSTRLVLEWLAATPIAGRRVLDYGCGSGILAIAAAKLGAAQVDAVDLDPDALAATGGNARANNVVVRAVAPERLAAGDYDILVANILAQPLRVLEPLLAARVRAGGRIALSGILEAQAPELLGAYRRSFDARLAALEDGWALIEGERR